MYARSLFLALMLCFAIGSAAIAHADATPTVKMDPQLEKAVKAVNAKDYKGAVDQLNVYVAANPKSADAFNYLGYSLRKLGDLDSALKNYTTALTIDPEHKGAHEYIGETYLLKNDLPKAKEHLARLDKICWLGCEEFTDLKNAIKAYEDAHKS